MTSEYHDRWIDCTEQGLVVRGYYFPTRGTKHIAYLQIRGIRRVGLTTMRGMWRIWGTANPHYWASWDPGRPHKKVGFVLDVGKAVSPLITPEDPEAFEKTIRERTGIDGDGSLSKGPVV